MYGAVRKSCPNNVCELTLLPKTEQNTSYRNKINSTLRQNNTSRWNVKTERRKERTHAHRNLGFTQKSLNVRFRMA